MAWAKKNLVSISSIWWFGESREWVHMDIWWLWLNTGGSPPNPFLHAPSPLSFTSLSNQWRIVGWRKRLWEGENDNTRIIVSQEGGSWCYLNRGIILISEQKCNWFSKKVNYPNTETVILFWIMKISIGYIWTKKWKNGDSDKVSDLLKVSLLIWAIIWS